MITKQAPYKISERALSRVPFERIVNVKGA